jgi:hypothetical protein
VSGNQSSVVKLRSILQTRIARCAVLLIVAGCTHSSVETLVKPECPGQRFAVVTSRWQQPLDVIVQNGTRAPTTLGTVLTGMQERFVLPDGIRSVYILTEDTPPYRVPNNAVDIRYVCE